MAKQQPHQSCAPVELFYFSFFKPNEDEVLSPEDKAEVLSSLRHDCMSCSPSALFQQAAMYDVLQELLEKGEGMDDDKFNYIINTYKLMTELQQLLVNDDSSKFTYFFTTNQEFVLKFPFSNLLELICCYIPAPACLSALLKSSKLRSYVNVDCFGGCQAQTPLVAAARNLSLSLIYTLLQHGADVHFKDSSGSTALTAALEILRSNKLIQNWISIYGSSMYNCTSIYDLFLTLSQSQLKDNVKIIHVLARASSDDVCSMLKPVVFRYDLVEFTLLLVTAFPMLFYATGATLELPSVCDDAYKERKLKTLVTTVWKVSENLCKLRFASQFISSIGVKQSFPWILDEYHEHYSITHLFEVPEAIPGPAKRAGN